MRNTGNSLMMAAMTIHYSGYRTVGPPFNKIPGEHLYTAVSYTHLRAHETRHDLVCRLLPRSTPLYSSAASDVYKRQMMAAMTIHYSGYRTVGPPFNKIPGEHLYT